MKKTKVMVFGSFDLIHPGHLFFFQEARKLGDFLFVVVARDDSILRIKGRTPFFNEKKRLGMVKGIKIVDKAVLGDKKDRYKVIAREKPDVIVLGYDQKQDESELRKKLKKKGLKTRVIRLKKAFFPQKFKSSKIRHLIMKRRKKTN